MVCISRFQIVSTPLVLINDRRIFGKDQRECIHDAFGHALASIIATTAVESCLSFVSGHARPASLLETRRSRNVCRAITISRQAGCGALIVAEKVAGYLQAQMPEDALPWTVFDRNLMDKVLEDH